jgi:short-subunit dehydrogenase
MQKSILIIGAGPGVSTGVAEKFGKNGFNVGLISRNAEKLQAQVNDLKKQGIEAHFATANAYQSEELSQAITAIKSEMGTIDVLMYNAAAMKMKPLLNESTAELVEDFKISVGNAFHAVQVLMEDLKQTQGAVLLTGGGFALQPSAQFGSLSLGKAGIRSLAFMLHESLKPAGIYVGTVTIQGYIQLSSETHSPAILAEHYWNLYKNRSEIEVQH